MAEYLIAFNDEWVPEHTDEELAAKAEAVRGLVAEMQAAGVLIVTGGLDPDAPVFSVDASSGTPLFSDGPYVESKEYMAGFWIIEAPHLDVALRLAAEGSKSCNRRVELRPFLSE